MLPVSVVLQAVRTHGIWQSMIARCKNKKLPNYGGRGIKVCPEWSANFTAFYTDMGLCPDGHSLERKDNDGNYEPNNCRWATGVEQANNRRSSTAHTHDGITDTQAGWARRTGVSQSKLSARLKAGWKFARAIDPADHDKYSAGNYERPVGDAHHNTKLSDEQVAALRLRFKPNSRKDGASAIARELGMSPTYIHAILTGKAR